MPAQFCMYIVRHGETDWNRARRIQGQLDVPLNETGLKQATLVAEALKGIPFAKAFSSDLQRASKTAECILQYHSSTVLERDEAIRERYMGELQGELSRSKRSAPSVETSVNFGARCLEWYLRTIVDYIISVIDAGLSMQEPRNILVVSHGAWIAVLLSVLQAHGLLICAEGVEIGNYLNTGVSIVEYTEVLTGRRDALVGTLIQYSDIEHLIREDLRLQEVNADVLESRGRRHRVPPA